MSRVRLSLIVLASAVLVPTLALTQEPPRGQEPGERRPGADAGQFRDRMLNNIKEQMRPTEDEWKSLAPRIEKIISAQRDLRGGRGGGRMPEAGAEPQGKVAQAQRELRTALEKADTPGPELEKKLAAYREARDSTRKELEALQKDLKGQVKPRQEAVLVLAGILE